MKSEFINGSRYENPFIKELKNECEEKNWIDLELAFRNEIENYILRKNKYTPTNINTSWQTITNNMGLYFKKFFDTKPNAYERMKKDSCAYHFYKKLDKHDKIYTFNYTNPYQFINKELSVQHVHGELVFLNDFYRDLILGVDKGLYDKINKEKYLVPLFKEYNSRCKDSALITKLSQTTELIIWGHSLGITDSDYFRDFFNNLTEGNSRCKCISIITKNKQARDTIVESLKTWDVYLDKLKVNCLIHFYYTENTNEEYNQFLSNL